LCGLGCGGRGVGFGGVGCGGGGAKMGEVRDNELSILDSEIFYSTDIINQG